MLLLRVFEGPGTQVQNRSSPTSCPGHLLPEIKLFCQSPSSKASGQQPTLGISSTPAQPSPVFYQEVSSPPPSCTEKYYICFTPASRYILRLMLGEKTSEGKIFYLILYLCIIQLWGCQTFSPRNLPLERRNSHESLPMTVKHVVL